MTVQLIEMLPRPSEAAVSAFKPWQMEVVLAALQWRTQPGKAANDRLRAAVDAMCKAAERD